MENSVNNEWQLTLSFNEKHIMNSKSDNTEFMTNNNANDNVD